MGASSLYFDHPTPLKTLYGTLDGHAKAGAPVYCGTAGFVTARKNQSGFEFYVRRFYDGDGKQREQYISGPAGDPDADARAEKIREEIAEVKALASDLRLLARENFQFADAKTYATLASLHLHGLFQAGGMLIGSHAFGVLLNQLGIQAAAYATEDVDIARREALAFPDLPKKSFLEMLRDSGIPFVEVPQLNLKEPSTRFKQRGVSRFHVDLLVPSRDETFPVIPVPELQAHATGLPYLAYLLGKSQEATLLSREGCCPVRVPLPERFALHKLVVSRLRVNRDAKTDKDIQQAAVLLAALGEKFSGAIEDAATDLPDAARRYAHGAMLLTRPLMEEAHPRAWSELTNALGQPHGTLPRPTQ